jgi:hypothetical protein
MLLSSLDNRNGIDVVASFGASVATDHFVMHEHSHHGERTLHYKSRRDGAGGHRDHTWPRWFDGAKKTR